MKRFFSLLFLSSILISCMPAFASDFRPNHDKEFCTSLKGTVRIIMMDREKAIDPKASKLRIQRLKEKMPNLSENAIWVGDQAWTMSYRQLTEQNFRKVIDFINYQCLRDL